MADVIGINLLTVATPSLLKKVVTLGARMRDPEDLAGGIQPFFLGQHTAVQRKSAATAVKWYSTVVGEERHHLLLMQISCQNRMVLPCP